MPILPLSIQSIVLGGVLAVVIAGISYRAKLLSASGAAAAVLVGGAVYGCGGWRACVALIVFFVSASLLTRWRKTRKTALGFEKGGRRDAGQVLANGATAALAIVAAGILPSLREPLTVAFLAALAEANADTWATEIGSASGATARLITTFRRAPVGMSGAISLPGCAAALAGSVLIGSLTVLFVPQSHVMRAAIAVAGSGFAGSLVDSLLGATVQAQYARSDGNGWTENRQGGAGLVRGLAFIGNDAVNVAAATVSSLVAYWWFMG